MTPSSGSEEVDAAASAPLVPKLAPAMSRRKTIAFGLALALAAVAGWAVAATTSSASDRFAATALVETRPFSLVATLPIAGPGNGGNVNALSLDWRNVGDEHVAGKLAVGDRNYNIPMVQIFRTSLDGAQFWTESVPDKYTPSDVVDLSWRPNGNTLQLLATISSPGTSDNLIQIIDERGFPKKLSGDGYRSAIWSPDGGRVAICRSDVSKTYIEIYNQDLVTLEKTIEHVGPQTVDNVCTMAWGTIGWGNSGPQRLAVGVGRKLVLFDPNAPEVRPIQELELNAAIQDRHAVAFSTEGDYLAVAVGNRLLLFERAPAGGSGETLYGVSPRVYDGFAQASAVAFHPASGLFAFASFHQNGNIEIAEYWYQWQSEPKRVGQVKIGNVCNEPIRDMSYENTWDYPGRIAVALCKEARVYE